MIVSPTDVTSPLNLRLQAIQEKPDDRKERSNSFTSESLSDKMDNSRQATSRYSSALPSKKRKKENSESFESSDSLSSYSQKKPKVNKVVAVSKSVSSDSDEK